MSNVITYDIWIFTFVCLCTDNFVPQLVCLRISILPAAFYNHCLPFECTYYILHSYDTSYVITFEILEVRIMSYWVLSRAKCFLLTIHMQSGFCDQFCTFFAKFLELWVGRLKFSKNAFCFVFKIQPLHFLFSDFNLQHFSFFPDTFMPV